MSVIKGLAICLLIGLAAEGASAQAARSPFSSFGIGDYYGNGMAHTQGMGNVGIANPQYWYMNNQNPALLTFNTLTVFSAGFIGERRTVKGDTTNESNGSGNLNYLSMAFPVKANKWTTAMGVMPYTNVNYQLTYTDQVPTTTDTVIFTEKGEGGLSQLYWSNGVAITPWLSLGLRLNYIFGSINKDYTSQFLVPGQVLPYVTTLKERTHISDFNASAGISFHWDSLLNKNYRINLGFVFDSQTDMEASKQVKIEKSYAAGTSISDTLSESRGTIFLPQVWGAGFAFSKGYRWTISGDFATAKYTEYRTFEGNTPQLTDAVHAALGGELTPDPGALSDYWKRMTYRMGVSYDRYPYVINGAEVRDIGINFGFSLPVSQISSLDLAFKLGQRGDLAKHGIEETYFKFYLGVTFNDRWFIKRKFD
jgi:hypothetical protein